MPLGVFSREDILAVRFEAIAAGADVNALGDSEPEGHREGGPLDACLRTTHTAA